MPDFHGMTPAQAERVAFEHGLELARSDHFYSAVVPAGCIVSQQPEPGTHVRRGWRVEAAESLGAQLIDIPAVLGMTSAPLKSTFAAAASSWESPPNCPPSSLAAGHHRPVARRRSPGVASPRVSLLYAVAPPEPAYAMPDLTGITLADATALITASGLKILSVTTLSSSPTDPFTNLDFHPTAPIVIGQTPAPGTRVTPSTDVSLQVTRAF